MHLRRFDRNSRHFGHISRTVWCRNVLHSLIRQKNKSLSLRKKRETLFCLRSFVDGGRSWNYIYRFMIFQSHGYKYLGTAHLKQRRRNLLWFDQSTKRQAKSIWHCHPIEDPAEDAVDVSMTERSTDQQRPHLLPSNGHYTQWWDCRDLQQFSCLSLSWWSSWC